MKQGIVCLTMLVLALAVKSQAADPLCYSFYSQWSMQKYSLYQSSGLCVRSQSTCQDVTLSTTETSMNVVFKTKGGQTKQYDLWNNPSWFDSNRITFRVPTDQSKATDIIFSLNSSSSPSCTTDIGLGISANLKISVPSAKSFTSTSSMNVIFGAMQAVFGITLCVCLIASNEVTLGVVVAWILSIAGLLLIPVFEATGVLVVGFSAGVYLLSSAAGWALNRAAKGSQPLTYGLIIFSILAIGGLYAMGTDTSIVVGYLVLSVALGLAIAVCMMKLRLAPLLAAQMALMDLIVLVAGLSLTTSTPFVVIVKQAFNLRPYYGFDAMMITVIAAMVALSFNVVLSRFRKNNSAESASKGWLDAPFTKNSNQDLN